MSKKHAIRQVKETIEEAYKMEKEGEEKFAYLLYQARYDDIDEKYIPKIEGIPEFEIELKKCGQNIGKWCVEHLYQYKTEEINKLLIKLESYHPQYASKIKTYMTFS